MKKLNLHFKVIILIHLLLVSINISYSQWTIVGTLDGINGPRPQVCVVDENTVFVTGGDNINATYKTTNGGMNWIQLNTGASRVFWALRSNDGNTVFTGDNGSSGKSYFYKYTDGESIWTVIDSIPEIVTPYFPGFRLIRFSNSIPSFGIAYAEGDNGDINIYKTRDGGSKWEKTLLPGYPGYYSSGGLNVIDSLFYAFCTHIGPPSIIITTDGGVTWNLRGTNLLPDGVNKGRGLAFSEDKLTGIAGSSSTPDIARTTDGGLTWVTIDVGHNITQGLGPVMRWIEGTDICYMTVKGVTLTGGVIKGVLKSTNRGLNWTAMETEGVGIITMDTKKIGSNIYGYAISYGDPYGGNMVLKFTDVITGINQVSELIPDGYNLSQNYPNPFNPETKIKFEITSAVKRQMSNVKLVIYNSLGKEVETLINENLQTGSYEIEFDGGNYSSGIYFYKLAVDGKNINTKRMVLLK